MTGPPAHSLHYIVKAALNEAGGGVGGCWEARRTLRGFSEEGRREEKRDGKVTPQGFLPTAAHGTRYPFNTFAVCQLEKNARMGEMG